MIFMLHLDGENWNVNCMYCMCMICDTHTIHLVKSYVRGRVFIFFAYMIID